MKLRKLWNYLHFIKGSYKKHTANILLNDELKTKLPLRLGKAKKDLIFITSIQPCTECPSHCNKIIKILKRYQDRKERGKPVPVCTEYDCLQKKLNGIYKTTPRTSK